MRHQSDCRGAIEITVVFVFNSSWDENKELDLCDMSHLGTAVLAIQFQHWTYRHRLFQCLLLASVGVSNCHRILATDFVFNKNHFTTDIDNILQLLIQQWKGEN